MPVARRFKPGGVTFRGDALGNIVEMHTSTCSHCQHITEIPSLREMHNYIDFCRVCMEEICIDYKDAFGRLIPGSGCAGKPCKTWLKKCDIEEAVYRRKFWGNMTEW